MKPELQRRRLLPRFAVVAVSGTAVAAMVLAVAAYSQTAPAVETGVAPKAAVVKALATDSTIVENAKTLLEKGRAIFRFETFGDEAWWTDTIQLHKAIAGERHGGIGAGVSPATALAVGLKVDIDAIPRNIQQHIRLGKVDLGDPALTLTLLELDAVVGVKATLGDDRNGIRKLGVTCALCHSTVDDSFAPGIGHRLDGWPNRDLNVGLIVSLAPNLQPIADLLQTDVPTVKTVLNSWGPGRYDAWLDKDGKAFRPDGGQAGTLIPPAFGLAGVNLHTWTGSGSVPYWNAYVAATQMRGTDVTFFDPRLSDPVAVSGGSAKRILGHTWQRPGQRIGQARRTSFLPALDPRADAAGGFVRRGRRGTRQGIVRREGAVRRLSRPTELHRAGLCDPQARRGRRRQLPGRPLSDTRLSDGSVGRSLGTSKRRLLPRRPVCNARRRHQPLRSAFRPEPQRG